MTLPAIRYCFFQIAGLGIALIVGCVFGCGVALISQMAYGHEFVVAAKFAAFMFVWTFIPSWIIGSAWALLRTRSRAKHVGVSFDYLGKLTRPELIAFQKKNRI